MQQHNLPSACEITHKRQMRLILSIERDRKLSGWRKRIYILHGAEKSNSRLILISGVNDIQTARIHIRL